MAAVQLKSLRRGSEHPCGDRGLAGIVLALYLLVIAWSPVAAKAQDDAVSASRTTVVVFADRPMREAQWEDLFAALRNGRRNGDEETGLIRGAADFIRGDLLQPGIRVETGIVVYLHGDCTLQPLVNGSASGMPLGWVRRHHAGIEPFIHVDCAEIGQVLGPRVRGMKKNQRMQVMAGAMARVILHEWIHIATQSPAHAESGIARAQFGASDLMAGGR